MSFLKKIFGSAKQDKPENYLVYCILGKVEYDRDKLHFLNNWMKCYDLLDKFLCDCDTKKISSNQSFCKIKPTKEKGFPRTSYSNAPTGGSMKWNEKNNRKICATHLEKVLTQLETAAQVGLPLQEWIETQFPEMDTFTVFYKHEVLAKIEAAENPSDTALTNDFIFRISCSSDVMRGFPANQQISIFISDRYAKIKGNEVISSFVREVGKLAHAVKMGSTHMPLSITECTDTVPGGKRISSLIWRDYGDIFNSNFISNPAGNEWTVFE